MKFWASKVLSLCFVFQNLSITPHGNRKEIKGRAVKTDKAFGFYIIEFGSRSNVISQ
jgi:hypothetical protein